MMRLKSVASVISTVTPVLYGTSSPNHTATYTVYRLLTYINIYIAIDKQTKKTNMKSEVSDKQTKKTNMKSKVSQICGFKTKKSARLDSFAS